MGHILDNMIWNAITTGNKDIAIINGDVGCYLPEIAPFAGMKDFNDSNLNNPGFGPSNCLPAFRSQELELQT